MRFLWNVAIELASAFPQLFISGFFFFCSIFFVKIKITFWGTLGFGQWNHPEPGARAAGFWLCARCDLSGAES